MKFIKITLVVFVLDSCSTKPKESVHENSDQFGTCGNTDEIGTCGNVPEIAQPTVFKTNCAICHMLEKNSTGPKLIHILDSLPSEDWFAIFLRNEDSLLKANDKYAIKIQEWSPVYGNHNFKNLTDKDINEIKAYLKQK